MKRALLVLLAFILSLGLSAQQLYWVGANGSWDEPNNWSLTLNGPGGAGVPDANTSVIIPDLGDHVSIQFDSAEFKDLIVEAQSASIDISGEELNSFGNISLNDSLNLYCTSWIVRGNAVELDPKNAIISARIELANESGIALKSPLNLQGEGSLEINSAELHTNGHGLTVKRLIVSASGTLELDNSRLNVTSEIKNLSNNGVSASDAVLSLSGGVENVELGGAQFMAIQQQSLPTTCGTGPGETEFTVTAQVITNYNGEVISCNGLEDGAATVTVSGGIGPFTFQWIGGDAPGFNQNYNNLGAGTYTVLVTDQGQGITCVDNVQLAEPPPITVFQLPLNPPSCEGLCNGSGSPIAIGGVPGYSFEWSNGETSQNATMLCEGANTLTITDANDCVFDSTFTLEVEPIIFNLMTVDVLCNGTATGEATVNPSGGSGGPYDISWSSGGDQNTETGLIAGSYTVTITDTGNCVNDTTFTITEEPPAEIILDELIDETCPGDMDGSISISMTGGTPLFSYEWTGPNGFMSADEDISGLGEGTYNLTVTDANLCVVMGSFEITAPEELSLDADIQDVNCAGETTGSIDLTVTGGMMDYGFDWSGPNGFSEITEDISGLEAGSYSVTVTDANGCSVTMDYDVIEPADIDTVPTLTDPSCTGGNDGSIEIEISGGTGPFSTTWSGPNSYSSADEDIFGLEAGSYSVEIEDSNGCISSFSYELTDPDPIDVAVDGTPISCPGAADATIDITVTGGTPDYTYTWTGPAGFTNDQEDIGPLGPGTYNLTITDAGGCTATAEVILSDPLAISILGNITNVSCGGLADGAIEVSVLGGTPDYSYAWTGPGGFISIDEDIVDLIAGDYELTVTDAAGCVETETFTVNEEPPLEVAPDVTDIDCNGAGNGAIDLNISGGVQPYTVDWTGPDGYVGSGESISGLEAGDYNYNITDGNSCPLEGVLTVTEAPPIVVDVIQVDPLCDGFTTGSIELIITGGQEPYTVTWLEGFSGPLLTDLPAGTYTPTVTDALGCLVPVAAINLVAPPPIDVSAEITSVLCNGDQTGAIEIEISGGTPDYTINWTGPNGFVSMDEDIFDLEAGSYSLTITDANGCEFNSNYDVSEPEALDITGVLSPLVCASDLGSIDLSVSGGTPDYIFEWSGPNAFTSNAEDLVDVEQGTYSVIVTDDNSCVGQASFDLIAPDPLVIDATVTPLDCSGDDNGSIEVEISGGQPFYNTAWSGPDGYNSNAEDIFDLAQGDYTLVITDQNGCELDTTFTLDQPPLLELTATIDPPLCAQQNTGAIDVEITGGFPDYTYTWTGPDGFGSPAEDISNLNPGDYVLHVEDQGNCMLDTMFTLSETPGIELEAVVINILCGDEGTGSIELDVSGGTPEYEFNWDGPEGYVSIDEDIFNLDAGTYDVTITDANLCSIDSSFTISQPNPLELTITAVDPVCAESNGSAEVSVVGGSPDYIYEWLDQTDGLGTPIGNTALIENLTSGLYEVIVTDATGCQVSELVPLTDQPLNAEFDITDLLCFGDANGTIDLSILDGTEPFIISWTGPDGFSSAEEDIADLSAGEYILSVEDANGCLINEVIDINSPDELVLDPETTDIFCNGGDNGEIALEVFGGTEPYNYDWTGPDSFTSIDEDLIGLSPGNYTLVLTDENGCQEDTTVSIIESTIIDITLDVTDTLCFGDVNGSIDLTVNGGTQPYDFNWSGPNGFSAMNEDLIDLIPGDYMLNLTDINGCETDTTVTINEAAEILADIISIQPTCGADNGAFEVTASGGVISSDYQYIWYDISDGNSIVIANTANVSNLPAGIFYIEIFDDLGCSYTQTLNLSDQTGEILADITDVLCFGDANGTIAITVNGATEPYQGIGWTGPNGFISTDQNISDLEAGVYTVVIDDALGCTFTEIFEVGGPDEILFDITIGEIQCAGDTNGSIEVVVNGGTAPYDINWFGSGGFSANGPGIFDLGEGCYDLVVQDSVGCTADSTICLESPDALELSAVVGDILCGGTPTGSIDLSVVGGSGNYLYNWVGPDGFEAGSEDINLIFSGSYDVQVTDENGCSETSSYFVNELEPISVDPLISDPLCPGDDNGTITLQSTGGTTPLTIEWLGPDGYTNFGDAITDLADGTYTWLITDDIGCFLTDSITLTDPDTLQVQILDLDITCFGDQNGSIELEISGGVPDYSVFWTGPNSFSTTAEDIFDLEAGTYEYLIGDENACSISGTVQINEPLELVVDLNNIVNPNCSDSFDGQIDLETSGGTPEYTFTWTGPDGYTNDQEDATDLGPGLYDVLIEDASGCQVNYDALELFALVTVTANAGPDTAICANAIPLILYGQSTGASSTAWYDIDNFPLSDSDTLTVFPEPGEYFYVFEAEEGVCSATDTVFVTIWDIPYADAGEDLQIFPEEEVEIGGDPTSDNFDHTLYWNPGTLLNDSTLWNPTAVGVLEDQMFTVVIIDENNCVNVDSMLVSIIPEIVIPSGFSPNGDNTNDTWIIDNVGLYPSIVVEIYNRWGDRLYRNVGYTEPWDGYYEGEALPIGTYYYVIDINEPDFQDEITGPITILR